MAFENIVGNDKIKELLEETINSKRFLHSYLFSGKDGIGKKLFAIEFASCILFGNRTNETMKKGLENGQIASELINHPDFSLIEPDGNSIKIEQIRLLQSDMSKKPIETNKKVYIINDSEKMTTDAQNCLLKTLEEPPEYGIIILICNNESMLLSTIKSRCTKLSFSDIPKEKLKNYVEEDMLDLADGSIGKAIKLREKQEIYENLRILFENVKKCDKIDFIKNAEVLYKSKDSIQEVLEFANVIIFNKAKENEEYINCVSMIEKAKTRLKQNANFDMTIDNLCFSLWEEINENYNRG